MSDNGRQSMTDKATAALKPDSEKSTTEHFGDMITGKADNVGSHAEPQGQKSYTQKAGDTLSGNNTSSSNESTTDKVKNALGLGN